MRSPIEFTIATINRFLSTFRFVTVRSASDAEIEEILTIIRPKVSNAPLIRIGTQDGDGGYLLPDDLDGIEAVFSPGVADNSDFELHFASNGVDCFLLDGSVNGPPQPHPKFHFEKAWLGARSVTQQSGAKSARTLSLDDWVSECLLRTLPARRGGSVGRVDDQDPLNSASLILQMDIEGAEWDVLASLGDSQLDEFRIIVLELHGLDEIVIESRAQSIKSALSRLTQSHEVVHFHANNCCTPRLHKGRVIPRVAEITLVHRGRGLTTEGFIELPHKMDVDNFPDKAPISNPWSGA